MSMTTAPVAYISEEGYTPDEKESRVVNRLRNLFTIARDHKRTRYDAWMRNYRLVNNRIGGSGGNSTWMPNPRDSEIYPGLSSLVAWMTDQEIDIDLIPSADPNSDIYSYITKIADDLNDVMYTNWHVEDYTSQIKLAIWDALLYGAGIYKNVWDASLAGGYGNAILRRTDPWAFYVDPQASSEYDMEFCCEVRRMSLEEIQRRFPETWRKVGLTGGDESGFDERPTLFNDWGGRRVMTNPGAIPSSGAWPGTSPAVGRWAGVSKSQQRYEPLPGYVCYEYWIRQNVEANEDYDLGPDFADNRYNSTWRLVVVCNGRILLDCDTRELWEHGGHPYERFVFDDIGEFYGISLVDHLAYPQIYINRLLTALQHNAELTGNPIFIEGANSGLARVGIINRPGQRLTVTGAAAMNNRPDWLTPPAMPAQVTELVQFWISRIENTLGLSALQKGITPTQRNAEGALNMVQEAAFVRIRSALTNLEGTLQRCMEKLTDLVVENYTEPRMMAIIGRDGQMVGKALAGRHFTVPGKGGSTPLKYVIRIECGAAGPTSRSSRIMETDKLFAMGAVDDEYVLQRHRVRDYQQVLSRLYEKRAKGVIGAPNSRSRSAH